MKKNFDVALRPIHYASVSGGKDSLYMLGLILNNPQKYPLDMVVHFDLEIDYPWVKNVINEMETRCQKLGIKFVRIKPRKTWIELYNTYGFPHRQCRWCNSQYKLDCEKQLREWIIEQNCRPVAYIGLCADETKRHLYTIGQIKEGQDIIYPLAEENINECEILEWAKNEIIFEDWYKLFERQGCMHCPMTTYKELAYQLLKYPNEYEIKMQMCKDSEIKYNTCIYQGNRKYNSFYVDNIVRTKYVPKLLKEMEEKGIK